MKIVIITQGINPIIRPLLNSGQNVIGIVESEPRKTDPPIKKSLKNVLSRINSLMFNKPATLDEFCRMNEIPYFLLRKSNSDEFKKWLNNHNPELVVIHSMSQLLTEDILSIPLNGVINLHPSLLPAYRGPNPLFWTYYNCDKKSGNTIHFVDKGEDTGDIINQREYPIRFGENSEELYSKMMHDIGIPLLLQSIENIEDNSICLIKQPGTSPTNRARNLSEGEYSKIIDWDEFNVTRIWHLLNGFANQIEMLNRTSFDKFGKYYAYFEYEICKTDLSQIGCINNIKGKKGVICKDGIVYIQTKYSIKKVFSDLLNVIGEILRS